VDINCFWTDLQFPRKRLGFEAINIVLASLVAAAFLFLLFKSGTVTLLWNVWFDRNYSLLSLFPVQLIRH